MIAAPLKRARSLIAAGWSEPMCRSASGQWCFGDDEGVEKFSVDEALRVVGVRQEGWDVLEAVVAPATKRYEALVRELVPQLERTPSPESLGHIQQLAVAALLELPLQEWLQVPERTLPQVLRVFDLAVQRAAREGT